MHNYLKPVPLSFMSENPSDTCKQNYKTITNEQSPPGGKGQPLQPPWLLRWWWSSGGDSGGYTYHICLGQRQSRSWGGYFAPPCCSTSSPWTLSCQSCWAFPGKFLWLTYVTLLCFPSLCDHSYMHHLHTYSPKPDYFWYTAVRNTAVQLIPRWMPHISCVAICSDHLFTGCHCFRAVQCQIIRITRWFDSS